MTVQEEPSWPYEQLPPDVRGLVAQVFEELVENSEAGTVYQETFFSQTNQPAAKPGYWTRWEYDSSEWELFDRLDWGIAWQRFLLSVSATVLLYFIIVSLFEMVVWSAPSNTSLLFPALFVPLMLLLPTFLLSYFFVWLKFREARKRHIARQSGPRRVTIGSPHLFDQDMWLAGLHIPLQELFIQLLQVNLSSRPPIVLGLQRRHSIKSGNLRWRDTIHVLVPREYEDEASQLIQRFRTETIGASTRRSVPTEPE